MSQFSYKAKKGPQEILQGTVEAQNVEQAIAKILKMGCTPLDVVLKTSKPKKKAHGQSWAFLDRTSRVPAKHLVIFSRQMSDLLDAGIPVLRALALVREQTRHIGLNDKIKKIADSVRDGKSLSDALSLFPETFSTLYINLIRAGEVSGQLPMVARRLADLREKDWEVRSQITSSLLYPVLILVVGILTVLVLFIWVIPRIMVIFEDLNQSLPLVTVILLKTSEILSQYWWILAVVTIVGAGYFRKSLATESGKLGWDTFKLKIPIIGRFLLDAEIGRFARTLGTLIENGVVIVTAIDSVVPAMGNDFLRKEVGRVSGEVKSGRSLSQAMKVTEVFPDMAINMVSIGEETGRIQDGLYKLATYYERQSAQSLGNLTRLLEPVLILTIGLVVGFIVMAILLPIFKMNFIVQ